MVKVGLMSIVPYNTTIIYNVGDGSRILELLKLASDDDEEIWITEKNPAHLQSIMNIVGPLNNPKIAVKLFGLDRLESMSTQVRRLVIDTAPDKYFEFINDLYRYKSIGETVVLRDGCSRIKFEIIYDMSTEIYESGKVESNYLFVS